jgi:hypothetical protein|tara:strand:+ start:364 stop:543 length:180 start_codon:yes stop_codon:yes gene_type:complete
MAAYAVVDYTTSVDPLLKVLADMETKLETLDSTTNVIRLIDVVNLGGDNFQGYIIYDGA